IRHRGLLPCAELRTYHPGSETSWRGDDGRWLPSGRDDPEGSAPAERVRDRANVVRTGPAAAADQPGPGVGPFGGTERRAGVLAGRVGPLPADGVPERTGIRVDDHGGRGPTRRDLDP